MFLEIKEVIKVEREIIEELKKLKLEEKSIQEQKQTILEFLSKRKELIDIYKGTEEVFEMLSDDNPLLEEFIKNTFINPKSRDNNLGTYTAFSVIDIDEAKIKGSE